MGKLSNYAENKVLDHVLKVANYARPANLYLGLCTADPTDAGTGATIAEPIDAPSSDASYVRKACDTWTTAASRAISNSVLITFNNAETNWSPITHFAVVDAAGTSVGNMIAYGLVTPNKTFYIGNTPNVAIGDLDVSFDAGGASNYLANELLDHLFVGSSFPQPAALYVALATSGILDADTGATITEPGANYARIQHTTWSASSSGISKNTGTIVFAKATAAWGTITDVGLLDALASSASNLLVHTTLATAQPVEIGDIAKWTTNAFVITLD